MTPQCVFKVSIDARQDIPKIRFDKIQTGTDFIRDG